MSRRYSSICFFLTTGKTFTFRDVDVYSDNETAIEIEYTAMSDGNVKRAVFYKTHVAGIAKFEREDDPR